MATTKLLDGIGVFQAHFQENQAHFHDLAIHGQTPEILWIGCCDSRVPVELITNAQAGDLFVTRNIGNIVPPYGTGEMALGAVIEYAVIELQVNQIILCGHSDCGAIRALDHPPDWGQKPHLARWIEHARPARTRVEASGLPAGEQHLATVKENVLLQLANLRSYDPVRHGEQRGTLDLHGWVYSLETGTFEIYDPDTGSWHPLGESES
jgi:carbonic anhydrase